MRGKLGILLGAAVLAADLLAWSAPALADSVTTLQSYSDPRGAMPQRPGHVIKRVRYGYSTTQEFVLHGGGSFHNVLRHDVPSPCTNCWITDIVPSLVYVNDANHPDGTDANLDTDAMMHHFVLINRQRPDPVCPGGLAGQIGERFFASGNERSQMHLPSPFGYQNGRSTWSLISHVINKGTAIKSLNIQLVFQYRTSGAAEAKPLWWDIDGCGDSEYTTPTGYHDATVDWTSTVGGRFIGMAGHMHDVDVTNSQPCVQHCPEKGHGIAVSAEVLGGDANTYFGPIPPNNPPPASLTGTTLCRSEGYYGTPWAGTRWRGHLDTVSQCAVNTDILGTAQAEAWPDGGDLPLTGYPFNAGQTIRLHSEYQNDTGQPQTDVMGIMVAWYTPTSPGYPRPKAATPVRVSLVPAYRQCTTATDNRVHGPPDFPGNSTNPDVSCSPPAQTSSALTVGAPDANSNAAQSVGWVRISAASGDPVTSADEADAEIAMALSDVRRRSDLGDYTGQLQLETTVRITDRSNGPSETATVQDIPYRVTVPCVAIDTAVGATCTVMTSADAVTGAGSVIEGRRAIWRLDQVRVNDGGADGVVSTTPNALFAVQGVFIP
jgi:hypothetical protein